MSTGRTKPPDTIQVEPELDATGDPLSPSTPKLPNDGSTEPAFTDASDGATDTTDDGGGD